MVNMAIQTDSSKLRVIYASESGFHGVDLDSASVYDIFVPRKGEPIQAHSIVPLPSSNGRVILLCYDGRCSGIPFFDTFCCCYCCYDSLFVATLF